MPFSNIRLRFCQHQVLMKDWVCKLLSQLSTILVLFIASAGTRKDTWCLEYTFLNIGVHLVWSCGKVNHKLASLSYKSQKLYLSGNHICLCFLKASSKYAVKVHKHQIPFTRSSHTIIYRLCTTHSATSRRGILYFAACQPWSYHGKGIMK